MKKECKDMNGLIELKDEKKGEVLILRAAGRLDAISSPIAEHAIFDFITEGWHKLLLDFSKVEYLSSAGIRMLLSITKKLRTLSGKLVVYGVTPNVMDVLKMSGFDHVLEMSDSEEEGMRRL